MTLYRSTIRGSQDGQTIDVIMGWIDGIADSVFYADSLASRVSLAWNSILAYCVDDYEVQGVDVIGLADPTVAGSDSTPSSGALTTAPLPEFVVANVKLSTGLRGRSYTGRFGIPGQPLDACDTGNGNLIDSGRQAQLQTALGTFIAALSSGGHPFTLAVVSTISGGTPRPAPIGTAVTTATVQSAWGSRVSLKG